MTKEENKEQKSSYNWRKYAYSVIAGESLKQENYGGLEGRAARELSILITRDHEGLARELAKDPRRNFIQIAEADTEQNYKSLSELTVGEELKEIIDVTKYKEGFAPQILKYENKKISELMESATKYNKALEDCLKAKTPKEAAEAKAKQNRYEEKAKVYSSIREYDMYKIKAFVTEDILRQMIKIDQREKYNFNKKAA